MIKIIIKNAGLGEKVKILIDNSIVDTATLRKPAMIELESGKHILQLKNSNGTSTPIEISAEDNITELVFSGNFFKCFKEGYWELVSPASIGNNTTPVETTPNSIKKIMYCNKCGAENLEGSAFCSSCGNRIEQISTQTINETVRSQNTIIDNSIKSNNEKTKNKKTNAMIIIAIIIIGLILGVGFAMFNSNSSNDVSVKIKQSYVTSDKEMRILFFDNGSCIMYESGATQDETFPALYTIDKENKEIILKFDNGSIFGFEYISSTSIRLAYHIENGRKIKDSILFTLDEKFMK